MQWKDACKNSLVEKAVANVRCLYHGRMQEMDIIINIRGDAFYHFPSNGIPQDRVKSKQLDKIKNWRPFR